MKRFEEFEQFNNSKAKTQFLWPFFIFFQTVRGNKTVGKGRLGPIVTETLKNRILITIDTPKELAFYAESMFLKSLSLILTIENYELEEICLNFEKGKKSPENQNKLNKNKIIRFRISEQGRSKRGGTEAICSKRCGLGVP